MNTTGMYDLTLKNKHTYGGELCCLIPPGTLELAFIDEQGRTLKYHTRPGKPLYSILKKIKVGQTIEALYGTEICGMGLFIDKLHVHTDPKMQKAVIK